MVFHGRVLEAGEFTGHDFLDGLDAALQLFVSLLQHVVPLQQVGGLPRVPENSFIFLHVLALDVLGQLPVVGSQLVILVILVLHCALHVLDFLLQLRELFSLFRDNFVLHLELFDITLGFLLLALTGLQAIVIRLTCDPAQRINLNLRCITIPQQSFDRLEVLLLLLVHAVPDRVVDVGQGEFGGDFNAGIPLPNPISSPQRYGHPVIRALSRLQLRLGQIHWRRHPALAGLR